VLGTLDRERLSCRIARPALPENPDGFCTAPVLECAATATPSPIHPADQEHANADAERESLDTRCHKVDTVIVTPRDSLGAGWASRRFASWRAAVNAIPRRRRQAGAQPAVEERDADAAMVPLRPRRD
jgi:hypothetical protein